MLRMSNEMDDIITTGSAAAAASPGFLSASGEDFAMGGIDFGGGTGTEEVEGGGDESQAVGGEEEGPAKEGDTGGRRPKKGSQAAPKPPVEPRIKWMSREDVLLAEAWKDTTQDTIHGSNQAMDNHWKRVKTAYGERQMINPDFAGCLTERGQKAMSNYWALMQTACNKWHGIVEEDKNRPKSGANREMEVARMLEA